MTQQPAAARGRRNPQLLQDQAAEQAQEPDALDQELDESGQLLYDGETVTFTASIPVTLDGTERYSLLGGEAHAQVQVGEDPQHTAARARLAVRMQILEGVDELEQDLAALAEERAANRARIQAALQ